MTTGPAVVDGGPNTRTARKWSGTPTRTAPQRLIRWAVRRHEFSRSRILSGILNGRVAIVTGAGRGIGRGHAIEFARQGAKVVVNDIGAERDGSGSSNGPAGEVVDEIRAMGGQAVANGDDVSDWAGAGRLVASAIQEFGQLDIIVNNAGILRDRMLINMTPEDWDAVVSVNLRGTAAVTHHAAVYWRARAKAGETVDARVISTSSSSGIYGNVGQTNYGAAKAGVASFTVIAAKELANYGVTVNAINPGAQTRLTSLRTTVPEGEFDARHPDNVGPLVAWLASKESAGITGRVFNVRGGHISVAEGWVMGPRVDKDGRWDAAELGSVVPDLVRAARGNAEMSGLVPDAELSE
ncbi:SDR family oxidoreductase [Microbacterium sp. zg-YB36]|uniref:SDR family oxidoreductase n=1 Tax=Microbacterium sp. zg-YB36 TaxID=2969407 RepID=UPI00214BBCFA|nr:SDR family oxidoreductase [Microbacterium sp. zg-YB36]MDL5353148.1 SDR family oxidoreductase [Microbacterium sp. zg-YB36]